MAARQYGFACAEQACSNAKSLCRKSCTSMASHLWIEIIRELILSQSIDCLFTNLCAFVDGIEDLMTLESLRNRKQIVIQLSFYSDLHLVPHLSHINHIYKVFRLQNRIEFANQSLEH
jgi:hypothetical protein